MHEKIERYPIYTLRQPNLSGAQIEVFNQLHQLTYPSIISIIQNALPQRVLPLVDKYPKGFIENEELVSMDGAQLENNYDMLRLNETYQGVSLSYFINFPGFKSHLRFFGGYFRVLYFLVSKDPLKIENIYAQDTAQEPEYYEQQAALLTTYLTGVSIYSNIYRWHELGNKTASIIIPSPDIPNGTPYFSPVKFPCPATIITQAAPIPHAQTLAAATLHAAALFPKPKVDRI